MPHHTQLEILLADDNPGDVRMVAEGLKDTLPAARLSVASDGAEAIQFLRRKGKFAGAPRPDLILLDLRLPKRNGFEVLRAVREDPFLTGVPVVIQSSSAAPADVNKAYNMHANCFITKSADLDEFARVMRILVEFWITVAKLPEGEQNGRWNR